MKYIIEDTTLSNIADAIRSKTGDTTEYTPAEMPAKIESIETGGGSGTGGGGYSVDYINRALKNGDKSMENLLSDIDSGIWLNGKGMFDHHTTDEWLQLSGKNIKLTDCNSMFYYVTNKNLADLDLSKFDISKVLDFQNCFASCNFNSIDLTGMKFKEGTIFNRMFYGNTSVINVTIDFSGANKIKDLSEMFRGCKKIENINGLDNIDTSNVSSVKYMFSGITSFIDIDISNFVLRSQNTNCDMDYMFSSGKYNSIKFPTSGEGSFNYLFNNSTVNELVDMGGMDVGSFSATVSSMISGATFYGGLILPGFPKANSTISLANTNTEIYTLKFGEGKTFGSNSTSTATLNLTFIWKKVKSTIVPEAFGEGTYEDKYLEFANSIAPNTTGKTRTIKLYTSFYNSLSDEQKALLTDKGYTLSYGTS